MSCIDRCTYTSDKSLLTEKGVWEKRSLETKGQKYCFLNSTLLHSKLLVRGNMKRHPEKSMEHRNTDQVLVIYSNVS